MPTSLPAESEVGGRGKPEAPIGVFDSGVGGLSVLREIRRALPSEDLIYVADSAAAPYGDRPREFIINRAHAIVRFLHGRDIKALVVACNTATAVAIQGLRSEFSFPIIAIEPAVKPAVEQTRSGVVGILATSQTIASDSFSRLVSKYGGSARVIGQPCPELVEQVEHGDIDTPRTTALVRSYLEPLLAQGADTIVLGCTHYPFLMSTIKKIAGPGVGVIDPAVAVVRELKRRLESNDLRRSESWEGVVEFWTTGQPRDVEAVVSQLWGSPVEVHAVEEPRG